MSRLPVFQRAQAVPQLRVVREENEPDILPFTRQNRLPLPERRSAVQRFSIRGSFAPASRMDLVTRARLLHQNRRCPNCRRVSVVPLDLGDGDQRSTGMPVPGTATLVGFYCQSCGAEWSAE